MNHRSQFIPRSLVSMGLFFATLLSMVLTTTFAEDTNATDYILLNATDDDALMNTTDDLFLDDDEVGTPTTDLRKALTITLTTPAFLIVWACLWAGIRNEDGLKKEDTSRVLTSIVSVSLVFAVANFLIWWFMKDNDDPSDQRTAIITAVSLEIFVVLWILLWLGIKWEEGKEEKEDPSEDDV